MSRKINFRLKKLLQEEFFGDFDSRRRGYKGYEIEEIRVAHEGDPPEAIHHRLSARRGRPMVKVTHPPSGVTAHLICDRSRSMEDKWGAVMLLVEVLADHLSDINAPFACSLVTEQPEYEISPGCGKEHTRNTLRILGSYQPRYSGTHFGGIAKILSRIPRPPRLVFLISDFLVPPGEPSILLPGIYRNDVIFCVLRHRRELARRTLLFGTAQFRDEETGECVYGFITDPPDRQVFGCDQAEFLADDTDSEIILKLIVLFERRRRREIAQGTSAQERRW